MLNQITLQAQVQCVTTGNDNLGFQSPETRVKQFLFSFLNQNYKS
jgi:hypothetical protein